MRKGASGFFEKGSNPNILINEIKVESRVREESATPLAHLGLIGVSEALQNVMQKVERLRDVDSSILLLGESGTGKEVIARAIHRTSKRAKFRFAAINCGAIPEALLESELFGHKRGSFTDAKTDRKGIFEVSSQGTLLLDEIGDMPLSLQTKLLRVLQEKEISPVGSSETIKIDTRIIAATHRDIVAEAESKRFREDLYYRLSIVVLRIPPLRERTEDIPLLVEHFLGVYNQKFLRNVKMPTPSEMTRMMVYRWPGNIRELQNSMERAVVLSTNGKVNLEDVFPSFAGSTAVDSAKLKAGANDSVDGLFSLSLTEAKQAFERRYLEHSVKLCRGNVNDLAEKSGRYRADVYRLLNRYGIEHAEYRV
jgi:DNA-binding NtrC family response regulator